MLHIAILSGNTEVMRAILKHAERREMVGRLVSVMDARGNTPLALALIVGNGQAMFELLEY